MAVAAPPLNRFGAVGRRRWRLQCRVKRRLHHGFFVLRRFKSRVGQAAGQVLSATVGMSSRSSAILGYRKNLENLCELCVSVVNLWFFNSFLFAVYFLFSSILNSISRPFVLHCAVSSQARPGDRRGDIGGEKGDSIGNIFWSSTAAKWLTASKSVYTLCGMYAPALITYRSPLSTKWQAAIRQDSQIADLEDLGFSGTRS